MLALVNTPGGNTPVELRDVAEPEAAANEAIVEVRAFSLNRGELSLLANRPEGWRPGQDIAGFFSYLSGEPASFGADLALLVSLIAADKLTPQIGLEESWHNLARALPALRERRVNGKAIFRVD